MFSRILSNGEIALAQSIFGEAIAYGNVRIYQRRWWPFQPSHITMAPDGHIWFHPRSPLWCTDFSCTNIALQGFFLHEMTHVWQAQTRGRCYLPLMRHPFCRYRYTLKSEKPLHRYGLEQQAEIIRHGFLIRQGARQTTDAERTLYEKLLQF